MAFSTPKQNPKCCAITNRTVPKSSTDGEKSRLRVAGLAFLLDPGDDGAGKIRGRQNCAYRTTCASNLTPGGWFVDFCRAARSVATLSRRPRKGPMKAIPLRYLALAILMFIASITTFVGVCDVRRTRLLLSRPSCAPLCAAAQRALLYPIPLLATPPRPTLGSGAFSIPDNAATPATRLW